PEYQQTLWQLYDCPVWAGNLKHCPTIAYSGEIDRQKQAADVMEQALGRIGIKLRHVIGPNTAHKIHPDAKIEIEAAMDSLARSVVPTTPRQIHFTTTTLRYHRMHWVDVQGLQKHWTPARVDASIEGQSLIKITTENVTRIRLHFDAGQWPGAAAGEVTVLIDGDGIGAGLVGSDRSWSIELERGEDSWRVAGRDAGLRKRPGLQGPIDDALMDSFLFVLPSGRSDDADVQAWVEAESLHAMLHWRKHFRGDVRMVLDAQLTPEQIASHHLIVFGDPKSNRYLQQISENLPLQWDDQAIAVGKAKVQRQGHVPIMIYPNPHNADRYVVINSGFTFREYDYLNNARQTPKLPDWALVDIRQGATSQAPGIVRAAGFFDESWRP
ncbi:MAG: hypothetical protein MI861_09130, partial [Pirellulales bacterium]|nr:hypothetical protein [Pirellulales bacterium]